MVGLKILCFGDSLTSGYFCFGAGEQPYAEALGQRLRAALPAQLQPVTLNVAGEPGALARQFSLRMQVECRDDKYDWAIILGGTNDIGYWFPPKDIYGFLKEAWAIPLSRGTKVLALTVPECKSQSQLATDTRNELNRLILQHKEPNFYAFDLNAHIPYHSLSPEDVEKYWDDGLHLSEEGYNWMGGHIADAFIPLAQAHAAPTATAAAAVEAPKPERRRKARGPKVYGDEASVEEEDGDPKKLTKGYVVVRKRDLE